MFIVFSAILGVLMIAVDQITKALMVSHYATDKTPITIIDGILSFAYTENNGAGFSLLSGKTLFLVVFTVIAMAIIVFLLIKGTFRHRLTDMGFCLVLSGGIGNLADRILRDGFVVDFIQTDFMPFPIFNVADICVTVGAALIIIYFFCDALKERAKKNDGKNHSDK